MGKASAFAALLNVDGGVTVKVFVGCDEARALKADQLDAFRKRAARLG
jgi:putative heme iron utilization protein